MKHSRSLACLSSTRSKTIVAALTGSNLWSSCLTYLPWLGLWAGAVMFGYFSILSPLCVQNAICGISSRFVGTDFICVVNFNTPSNVMWPICYQLKTSTDIGTGK